ncbi:MAG TPA: DUF3465 domain-containing protein [Xanthomonadales bacterium]|nr:DUF3465 domain-containing protein [Xanthomonadales bacterium]
MLRATKIKAGVWIALIVLAVVWRQFGPGLPTETVRGDSGLVELYAQQKSSTMVEFEGRVQRILPDDKDGSRHQRFILMLNNGHTVMVAHNIDLAERVPLKEADLVKVRGEYEYNAQGGLVHWTHRDPGAGTQHGWIELAGVRYD